MPVVVAVEVASVVAVWFIGCDWVGAVGWWDEEEEGEVTR